jgi:hypothetical protein
MLHRQRAMQQNLATAEAFLPRSPSNADRMPIAYLCLPSKPRVRIIEPFQKKQLSIGISEETASKIDSICMVGQSPSISVEDPIFPGAAPPVVALASNFGSLFQQSGRLSAWNFERSAESKQDSTR